MNISDKLLNINLPRCACCIMPDVKGHFELNDKSVCPSCQVLQSKGKEDIKGSFDKRSPEEKKQIFLKKLKRYQTDGKYDCAVAVSGGKDSLMTLYIAHDLGLHPLAIFVDNGFALDVMHQNIWNACDTLETDCLVYKTSEMKKLFRYFLESKKKIYYCRACHILLEAVLKQICRNYGIRLLLGGYTKGQSYFKESELSWIFEESDRNTLEVLRQHIDCREYLELYEDPIRYSFHHFRDIATISPFKYLDYDEEEIVDILREKLSFSVATDSWPENSTNCSFNYVSQYLAQKQFGYSQHETEFSDLIRAGEMTRERALRLVNTPITEGKVRGELNKLGLRLEDII